MHALRKATYHQIISKIIMTNIIPTTKSGDLDQRYKDPEQRMVRLCGGPFIRPKNHARIKELTVEFGISAGEVLNQLIELHGKHFFYPKNKSDET